MTRFAHLAAAAVAVAAGTVACNKSSADLDKRLTAVEQRLDKLEKFLAPFMKRPAEPDPAAVYAVPIDGNPYRGPAAAPITVVEAFEFA